MDWSGIISAFIGAALGSLGTTLVTLKQSRADRLADAYADLSGATTALIQAGFGAVFKGKDTDEHWTTFGRCQARVLLQERRPKQREQVQLLRWRLEELHSVDVAPPGVDPNSEEHRTTQSVNFLDRQGVADRALEAVIDLARS